MFESGWALFDRYNTAEVALCQFSGPGLKRPVYSTSCLLEPNHHAVRKPKEPQEETQMERNSDSLGEFPADDQHHLASHVSEVSLSH